MTPNPAEPLYQVLKRIRRPLAVKDILASCLRHVYMGDPFKDGGIPEPPRELFEGVLTSEVQIGDLRCVIYSPPSSEIRPLLVYMHGGAFVVGCSEDVDYIARRLCFDNSLTVISVNYRLAPEHMFPAALNDCFAVYDWACSSAADLGIDRQRIYLAGDSAGANLAASLALQLHKQAKDVQGLIMLAPWLDMYVEQYDSFTRLAYDDVVVDAPYLGFARACYAKFADWANPLVSPQMAAIEDFPPTIAFGGSQDPLVDQVSAFAARAKDQGCKHIEAVIYQGMPHCFYSFPNLFAEERDCFARISRFLEGRESLWSSS